MTQKKQYKRHNLFDKKGAGLVGDLLELKKNLKKPTKQNVSITIDRDLYEKIEELKKRTGIEKFSPIINHLLREYFKELEKNDNKENKSVQEDNQ